MIQKGCVTFTAFPNTNFATNSYSMELIDDIITVCPLPHSTWTALPIANIPPHMAPQSLSPQEHFNVYSMPELVETLPFFSVIERPHFSCHDDDCTQYPLLISDNPSLDASEELSNAGAIFKNTLSLTINEDAIRAMRWAESAKADFDQQLLFQTAKGTWFFLYSLPDTFAINQQWKNDDKASLTLKMTNISSSPQITIK